MSVLKPLFYIVSRFPYKVGDPGGMPEGDG